MAIIPKERVFERLWPRGDDGFGWALVDGARDPRLQPAVATSRLEHLCLFSGTITPALASAAPYLVRLTPDAPFTTWFVDEGWGRSWGVFARTDATARALHRHCWELLHAGTEGGAAALFRYYDPRVLRTYLAGCDDVEARRVFGPASSFIVEGADAAQLVAFHMGARGITRDEQRFDRPLGWLGDYLRKGREEG